MVKRRLPLSILRLFGLFSLAVLLASCGGNGGGGTTLLPTTLTVTPSGTGSGTVTGTNISCGDDCTENYTQGTSVTLSAAPNAGSTFDGWGGDCSGATCTVTMEGDKTVTATFNANSEGGGGTGATVSGTIQNWTEGEAVLKGFASSSLNPAHTPPLAPPPALVEAPINADGTFSFTLPDASAMEPYLEASESYTCNAHDTEFVEGTGPGVEVTPSPLETGELYFDVYANSADEAPIGTLGYFTESNNVLISVSTTFAASGGTATGSCQYRYISDYVNPNIVLERGIRTEIYNLELKAGWNKVIRRTEFLGNGDTNTATLTGDVPAEVVWTYHPPYSLYP